MELVVIFAIGWVMSHAFGEKRDEYSAAQEAHREKYLKKLDRQHPSWGRARREQYLRNAARRNALGHFAYLLRHGWSSTFNDVVHGWKTAKAAHEEWKAERGDEKKPSLWQTFKAGWGKKSAAREAEKAKQVDTPKPTPDPEPTKPAPPANPENSTDPKPSPDPAPAKNNEPQDARIYPWQPRNDAATNKTPGNTAGSTNGSSAMEFNFDRSKAEIDGISDYATAKLSMLEQLIADAIAGDNLSRDTESMSHLANLQEALSNVRAHANAFVASAGKHAGGQEYANTGHAANTNYLQSS